MSAAACHRPEPDRHVVEATDNTVRCGLPSGRIFIYISRDNYATDNGNDDPNCSEVKKVLLEILTEVASLGMTRSFWPARHLHQEDLAPSYGGSPKDTHVSSAPGHPEGSTGQVVGQSTVFKESRQDVGRTSSFPLTRRSGRTPCYPSQGMPGAREIRESWPLTPKGHPLVQVKLQRPG